MIRKDLLIVKENESQANKHNGQFEENSLMHFPKGNTQNKKKVLEKTVLSCTSDNSQ